MLTKENSSGFCPAKEYPTYRYLSKSGRREQASCNDYRIVPPPKGYREVVEYHDIDEHFVDYLRWNTEDHKDKPDQSFIDHPYGIFYGNWRNARWYDEAKRRGLVEATT